MRYILMVLMLALIGVQANAVEYPVYKLKTIRLKNQAAS